MASPHLTPLTPDQRVRAKDILTGLYKYYRQSPPPIDPASRLKPRQYRRADLLELVCKYTVSEQGQDRVLSYLLTSFLDNETEWQEQRQQLATLDLSNILTAFADFDSWDQPRKTAVAVRIEQTADRLVDYFFLPLRASGHKTPQPTPGLASRTDILPVGTSHRLSNLRAQCLIRDHHRCVITRRFDEPEAISRTDRDGANARDDDGRLLSEEEEDTAFLEVAHIIPHSLMSGDGAELNDSKKYILQVLDMFDPGITNLIDGQDIDRTFNALTLMLDMHKRFGSLKVYFEPVPAEKNNGAGEYIDKILRDEDSAMVKADGSTELGSILLVKLWDKTAIVP
ncbi:hypothetical protein GP486_008072 [Trichoglossum hirsutum]|uniref:HNH nuclease domain-containing protein n=1 Tax=Trichoglossum hirsutum TaxID=265104 RepID=A0A9P8IHI0_9PEZI|nr:hypothetical protein GP486_008072 [Trichoglossum hirsutum]